MKKNKKIKQKFNKALSITLITSMSLSMTGCNSIISDDVTKYPLVPALTTQEVIDYYANAMQYDAVVSRLNTVHETTYELKNVDDTTKEKLESLIDKSQNILSKMDYEYNIENSKVMTEDTFHYLKSSLNNYKLTDGTIKNMQCALGYYFVDVEYNIAPRTTGTFTQKTSLLGINGAIKEDALGNSKIDISFLTFAVDKMNEYYKKNQIPKELVLDINTGIITTINSDENTESQVNIQNNIVNVQQENQTESNNTEENILDTTETIPQAPGDDTEEISTESIDEELNSDEAIPEENQINQIASNTTNIQNIEVTDRKCSIDVTTFNKVVGSSNTGLVYMPPLNEVFNIPENEGQISGIGIYPAGGNGLDIFGCNRDNLTGKVTIRYVFKDTVDGTGNIVGTNAYVYSETVDSGIQTSGNNVNIPEYLKKEFEVLIDRADRIEIDTLLSSMIENNIYEDMGFGVLRGYEYQHTNVLKQMSVLRQVVARDIENNAYLLEIETTRTEGPKDVDEYGTYRDKYYIVVQQKDNKFVITDKLLLSRETSKEASISPDNATDKRIVALGLTGEIQDKTKENIETLMNNLYKAGTCRKLNGGGDVEHNGETVHLECGMYDCFNDDTSMLSSDELEYTNSKLRGVLVKHGTSISSEYIGDVTEWIGGTDNQAEFISEELVTYDGRDEAEYMEVYYLVSNMHDKWVIDERTVLNQSTVTGADIETIKSRINSK